MDRNRLRIAVVLSIIGLALTVIALIDPLEGGLALLVAIGLAVAARALSRMPIPRLELVGLIAAVAVAVVTIAILLVTEAGAGAGDPGEAANPLIGGAVLNWVYRLTVAVAIAGAVQYAARLVRRLRGARTTVTA